MIDVVDEILGDVLIAAPGCPDMTAERAIERATRQFCMDTHAWRYRTDRMPVIAELAMVDLVLPPETEMYRPFWVAIGERKLTGTSATELETHVGRPESFAFSPDGFLTLSPVPREDLPSDKGLQAEVSLVPKRGNAVLADELEMFLPAIESLAVATLLSKPAVEWRDRAGAADAMAFYHDSVIKARHFGAQRGQHVHRVVRYGGL